MVIFGQMAEGKFLNSGKSMLKLLWKMAKICNSSVKILVFISYSGALAKFKGQKHQCLIYMEAGKYKHDVDSLMYAYYIL